MRKWHRWFSFIFGAFLLFIAVTGVLSHVTAMVAQGSVFEHEEREKAPAANSAAGKADQGAPEQKKRDPKRKLVGLMHHLHSGEYFGPVGIVISLLSGFAMIFFSFSGLWLYFQMYVRRRKLGKPEPFWD
jgi:uncharacterized iron-regulated membrane protein